MDASNVCDIDSTTSTPNTIITPGDTVDTKDNARQVNTDISESSNTPLTTVTTKNIPPSLPSIITDTASKSATDDSNSNSSSSSSSSEVVNEELFQSDVSTALPPVSSNSSSSTSYPEISSSIDASDNSGDSNTWNAGDTGVVFETWQPTTTSTDTCE